MHSRQYISRLRCRGQLTEVNRLYRRTEKRLHSLGQAPHCQAVHLRHLQTEDGERERDAMMKRAK